jgi:hypothetical protein
MYRSRFRCNKTNFNSSDNKTTIYTNRSNRHVIDRMLEVGKKRDEKTNKLKYAANREERAILLTEAETLAQNVSALAYPTKKRQLERRIEKLEENISEFVSGQTTRNWESMTRSLYQRSDQHVGVLVISNRIMGRPTENFFMDPDKCPRCVQLYLFDPITNVHTCTKCGYTVDVLFISEDTSQDCLVTRDPNQCSTKPVSDYHYIRSPLYRRYLSQFGEDVPTIPTENICPIYISRTRSAAARHPSGISFGVMGFPNGPISPSASPNSSMVIRFQSSQRL